MSQVLVIDAREDAEQGVRLSAIDNRFRVNLEGPWIDVDAEESEDVADQSRARTPSFEVAVAGCQRVEVLQDVRRVRHIDVGVCIQDDAQEVRA